MTSAFVISAAPLFRVVGEINNSGIKQLIVDMNGFHLDISKFVDYTLQHPDILA